MKKHKRKTAGSSVGKGILITTACALASLLLCAALIATGISAETVQQAASKGWCWGAVAVSVLLGCLAGTAVSKEQWIITVSGGAATIFLVLLITNAALFHGQLPGILPGLLMVLLGLGGAAVIKFVRNKAGKNRRYKRAYR